MLANNLDRLLKQRNFELVEKSVDGKCNLMKLAYCQEKQRYIVSQVNLKGEDTGIHAEVYTQHDAVFILESYLKQYNNERKI
jgi:hypothetical protein